MNRMLFFLLLVLLFANGSHSQEKERDTVIANEADSLKTDFKSKGIVVDGTIEKKGINPLAPSKAAFFSAILPGLGQAYNKKYWKVPIVMGIIGGSIYGYSYNNTEYNRYRDAFKKRRAGFTDDEFYDINNDGIGPDVSDDSLQNAQERFQTDRDLWLLLSIAFYALNIIDANVDAHLKQYNVDENLVLDFKPYLNLDPIHSNPNYGMALVLKF